MKSFIGFALRSTLFHILTYVAIGALSYWLLARPEWSGANARPWMRNPESDLVTRWLLPAQFARGLLHGIALFPLRRSLLRMGRSGGLAIAVVLLLIGWIGGISDSIEQALYTTTFDLRLSVIHLPEVVLQALLYGYALIAWERRADPPGRTIAPGERREAHP
jgi:hypothetical protein